MAEAPRRRLSTIASVIHAFQGRGTGSARRSSTNEVVPAETTLDVPIETGDFDIVSRPRLPSFQRRAHDISPCPSIRMSSFQRMGTTY